MMKPTKLKPIKTCLEEGGETFAFYPRRASKAEREDVQMQISEAEIETVSKHQRLFEIKRDAIADWSVSMPQQIVKEKSENKLIPLVKDVTNISDAMKQFFAEKTADSEELISSTYNAFLNMMSAQVSFL